MTEQQKKNLGSACQRAEANGTNEAAKLPQNPTPETVTFATFFWCPEGGSVERFTGYQRGVAV